MSFIPLAEAKGFLEVIHDGDDAKLQRLLDAAEDEALQYMDRSDFGAICPCDEVVSEVESESMPPSVWLGVMLLLQAAYQATPDDMPKLRRAAEIKLHPYRCRLGA